MIVYAQRTGSVAIKQRTGAIETKQRTGLVTFKMNSQTITPPQVFMLDFTQDFNSQYINIIL